MLFDLTRFSDIALLLLRIIVAVVFISSGRGHTTNPVERGKGIGMSPLFTFGLGVWEMIGAVSILFGIFPQIGALMLICVMLGAMYKKIFVWHTGFFKNHTGGWHYDTFFLFANLVILTTGGGKLVII